MAEYEFEFDWDKELKQDPNADLQIGAGTQEPSAYDWGMQDTTTESPFGPNVESLLEGLGEAPNPEQVHENAGEASPDGSPFLPSPEDAGGTTPDVPDVFGPGGEAVDSLPEAGGGEEAFGFSDIDELRAEPWTTEFEQAALARADELVAERYKDLRTQWGERFGRQGIGPDSPIFDRRMREMETAQAREMSNFRRELQLEKINRRQQNLATARALEMAIHNMERQGILDTAGLLSGDPNYAAAAGGIGADLANLFGQQSAAANASAGSSFSDLGNILAMMLSQQQRSPLTINLSNPNASNPWENLNALSSVGGTYP